MSDSNASLPVSREADFSRASDGFAGGPAGDWRARLRAYAAQPAIRRAMPAIIGIGSLALVAMLYLALAGAPQRILYASLTDGERAKVVEALETGGIGYTIDNSTGAITVGEDELYRARMLVASDAGLASPAGASEMLDAIPMGSSRTLEGERLRLARERELMLTIQEIDGIEAVRVHLATPERSVFVRNQSAPSASVMLRLVSGRSLGQPQVEAIVNLVSASVPGMSADAVRVVDQNGQLLSADAQPQLDGLVLQREHEAKLQTQLASLLTPLLGEGNFSSQVQVELDQSEVTTARESYDKEGALRSESEQISRRAASRAPGGVPGVTANTPPPDAELVDEAPQPDQPADDADTDVPQDSESAVQRAFELDREVAVTATRAGALTKLSVAVAVSQEAMVAASPLTQAQLQALIAAAVGADTARGDMVEVAVSAFGRSELSPPAFYEQAWFGEVLRYATALIAVLLALLLGVRPLIARSKAQQAISIAGVAANSLPGEANATQGTKDGSLSSERDDRLPEQIELARKLAAEQPERALEALQRMLEPAAKSEQVPG